MQGETLATARAYTNCVTSNLGDCISLQFEDLINNIKTIRKMLKEPSQRLALPSSSYEKLN